MNEGQENPNNLIDTTDSLEAVAVFKCWKNFLFIIVVSSLFLIQVCFWLVNTGYIKAEQLTENEPPAVTSQLQSTEQPPPSKETETTESVVVEKTEIIRVDPNQPIEAIAEQPKSKRIHLDLNIKIEHVNWLIRFLNFVTIIAAFLYCLTLLFALKVSMIGRLGGINHIARAFFLSLIVFALLLPWQQLFEPVVKGVLYTPEQMLEAVAKVKTADVFNIAFFYLRFTGYWLLVFLLIIFAQFRSGRWTKTILRRLELI